MKINVILLVSLLVTSVVSCNYNEKPSAENRSLDTIPSIDSTIVQDSSMVKIGIKMEKSGGVYMLPCVVNGVKMNFVFDTGASNVSISLTEALFLLKNGYLEDYDILGSSLSKVADGSIVENTEINLHSVEVNGIMITDVKAVVSNSINAPLLLGQSAIQKLGKIEISGDSLYVIRKGIPQPKTNRQVPSSVSTANTEMKEPSIWRKTFNRKSVMMEYLNKAKVLIDEDMTELSLSYCEMARDLKNNSWEPYALLGHIYYSNEKYNAAIGAYLRYNELNKNKETLYFGNGDSLSYKYSNVKLAWSFLNKTNNESYVDDAIIVCQKVLEIDPNYGPIINPLIVAYAKNGEYDRATNWAKKLVEMPGKNRAMDGYFYLGYINAAQGRKSEAIRYYEKALEIDPESSVTLNNLSTLYYGTNRSYSIDLKKRAARLGNKISVKWLKDNGIDW